MSDKRPGSVWVAGYGWCYESLGAALAWGWLRSELTRYDIHQPKRKPAKRTRPR